MFSERTERMLLSVSNLKKKKFVAVFFCFVLFSERTERPHICCSLFVYVSVFSIAVVSVQIQNLKTNLDSNIFSFVLHLFICLYLQFIQIESVYSNLTLFRSKIFFIYCSLFICFCLQFIQI